VVVVGPIVWRRVVASVVEQKKQKVTHRVEGCQEVFVAAIIPVSQALELYYAYLASGMENNNPSSSNDERANKASVGETRGTEADDLNGNTKPPRRAEF
jgi:hypothetical protein